MKLKFAASKSESRQEKIERLMGQYPHNVWCPNCLKRMVAPEKADLMGDVVFCTAACSKEFRLENVSKIRRSVKKDKKTNVTN